MKKIVTIGELGIIITGNTPPRSNPILYGNYTPFIKATDILKQKNILIIQKNIIRKKDIISI